MSKIKCQKKYKSGFSLVEVLVSLLILSFGIVGISALMVKNIKTSVDAKNQVIGSELAQEGIELVRNLKDNGTTLSFGDYIVDKSVSSSLTALTGSNSRLYSKNGLYVHDSSSSVATKFYRKIVISIGSDSIVIGSFVRWDSGGSFPTVCNLGNSCILTISVLPT